MLYFPYPLWDLDERLFRFIGTEIDVSMHNVHEDFRRPGKRVYWIPEMSCDVSEHEIFCSLEDFRKNGQAKQLAAMDMLGGTHTPPEDTE